jgi:hypothetical protein
MARVSVDDIYSFPDPVIGFNFNLIVENPPGGGSAKALNVKCKSTSLPGSSIEPVEVSLHGHVIKRAGRRTFPRTLPFTLVETTDFSSRRTIRRWMNAARKARDQSGQGSNVYAVDATVEVLNDAGEVLYPVILRKAWVEELGDADLTGESSNPLDFSGQLSYDIVQEPED